jgi:hypothetical protein
MQVQLGLKFPEEPNWSRFFFLEDENRYSLFILYMASFMFVLYGYRLHIGISEIKFFINKRQNSLVSTIVYLIHKSEILLGDFLISA